MQCWISNIVGATAYLCRNGTAPVLARQQAASTGRDRPLTDHRYPVAARTHRNPAQTDTLRREVCNFTPAATIDRRPFEHFRAAGGQQCTAWRPGVVLATRWELCDRPNRAS